MSKTTLILVFFVGMILFVIAGEDWSPQTVVDRSPTIGFIRQSDAPARLLFTQTLKDKNGPQDKVRLQLDIKPTQDIAVTKYVAVCVETFAMDENEKSGVRETRHFTTGSGDADVFFDVNYTSDFYFYLETVTLEDGTVWVNK